MSGDGTDHLEGAEDMTDEMFDLKSQVTAFANRATLAERQAAAMRAVLHLIRINVYDPPAENATAIMCDLRERIDHALSDDAGKGWVSPERYAEVIKANAELGPALVEAQVALHDLQEKIAGRIDHMICMGCQVDTDRDDHEPDCIVVACVNAVKERAKDV